MSDTPIYDFKKLKAALERLGYTIGEAKPYVPIEVADVNLSNVQSGEVEITNEGIYYVDPNTGNKQQIFLYMDIHRQVLFLQSQQLNLLLL